jgi:endonuclease/exonuclease/phosphatase family metal-dependent hydrolase
MDEREPARSARSATRPPARSACSLRLTSYNVHRCIGLDRRCDPARIAAVIGEIGADIVCLQELEGRDHLLGGSDQLVALSEATSLQGTLGAAVESDAHYYGNAILSRWPVLSSRRHDLAVVGREPRCALDVDVDVDGWILRVIVAHFGLRERERRAQVDLLLTALGDACADAVVVAGDFNFWWPRSAGLSRLYGRFGRSMTLRTFPSRWPILPLDRVWVDPPEVVQEAGVHESPLARVASDHLPVAVRLAFDPTSDGARARDRQRLASARL